MWECNEASTCKSPGPIGRGFCITKSLECAYEGGSFAFLPVFDFLGFGSR